MLKAKPCRSCALKAMQQDGSSFCQLTRRIIDLDKDFCSCWRAILEQCDICHQYLAGEPIVKYNEEQTEFKLVCQACSTK